MVSLNSYSKVLPYVNDFVTKSIIVYEKFAVKARFLTVKKKPCISERRKYNCFQVSVESKPTHSNFYVHFCLKTVFIDFGMHCN